MSHIPHQPHCDTLSNMPIIPSDSAREALESAVDRPLAQQASATQVSADQGHASHSPPGSSTSSVAEWLASPGAATHDLRASSALYHHPLVRDIAWLLSTPDLLHISAYPRPSLSSLGLADSNVRHRWLSELEQQPQILEGAIDEHRHYRLGRYHELLWQFVLKHAPDSRLLISNLAIKDAKITLGELDLIYQTSSERAPTHLEVAIKFYLGLPEGPGAVNSPARWIGPGGADSLAIKYQRSLHHQLPLAHTPKGLHTLRAALDKIERDETGLEKVEPEVPLQQQLALPGCLFRPWQPETILADHLPPPAGCHPDTAMQAGWWVHLSDFPAFCAALNKISTDEAVREQQCLQGIVREKPAWLAPPLKEDLVPWHALDDWLHQHFCVSEQHTSRPPHPRQLWLELTPEISSVTSHSVIPSATTHVSHQWRVFVVPDDWPNQVPLPPVNKVRWQ